jgi:CRP-like cAMP-binding protein
MKSPLTIEEALRSINVLKTVESASITALAPQSQVRNIRKGEHIYTDRNEAETLFAVLDGTVAIYKLSTDGEKRGIFIYGPGALLNEEIIDRKAASINAEALRETKILCIKRSGFLAACGKDSKLSKAFMDSMAMKIRRLYHLMKNTTNNMRGDRRIAAKLWKLSRDHGVKTSLGTEINFDLSITLLAEFLGSKRETVSRQVKILTDAGLVIVANNRFIIPDREKLSAYHEEA